MNRRFPVYLLLSLLFVTIVSCVDSAKEEPITTSSNVAITSFKLSKDTSVVVNLDSVFFTIDLNKAAVYNADSLPKGSKVKKLVVTIGLPIVSSAELIVKDGELMKDTIINYLTHSKDSIDFTGNVTLKLTSEDRSSTRNYSLKVNVHNMKPDSLYWNQLARRDLPNSNLPQAQRTVERGNTVYCLVQQGNGFVISSTTDLASNRWTKDTPQFTFTPNINTLTTTEDKLYILSTEGELYSSINGISWESCNEYFVNILGGYENRILGIALEDGQYKHDEYPRPNSFQKTNCEQEFPIKGSSPMVVYTSEWGVGSQSIMVGGIDRAGKLVGDAWGYDGQNWAKLSRVSMPPLESPVLIPYFTFKTNKNRWLVTKKTTLVAIGGRKADGSVTKDVYISLDAGLNWKKGDALLQLPTYISEFYNAQAIVSNTSMSISRSNGWEPINSLELPVWFMTNPLNQSRANVQTWDCPYIYMFGGIGTNNTLQNNIWKGVINRLSFKPLI